MKGARATGFARVISVSIDGCVRPEKGPCSEDEVSMSRLGRQIDVAGALN